jgi:hypothetical protein
MQQTEQAVNRKSGEPFEFLVKYFCKDNKREEIKFLST